MRNGLTCRLPEWESFFFSLRIQLSRQKLNMLRTKKNCHHFADDNFKCIFMNGMYECRLKCHWFCWINNITALVHIMTWRRSGDKPLSEPMMVSLLTHICVIWPQWSDGSWTYTHVFIVMEQRFIIAIWQDRISTRLSIFFQVLAHLSLVWSNQKI